MNDAPCEKFVDSDGMIYALFDFGDAIGVVDPAAAILSLEYWFDHAGDGSGATNWTFDAFGRELDLEFTSSRGVTRNEAKRIAEVMA